VAEPVVTAITTAVEIYKIAEKEGLLRRIGNFLSGHKRKNVLVLGASGVGKTQFTESLIGLVQEIRREQRTQKPVKSNISVDKKPYEFTDTPGQIFHAFERKPEILKAIQGKIDGIINVVAYGYHEGDRGVEEALDERHKVRASFLQDMRQQEIDLLSEWTDNVGAAEAGKWLITLITKADLWWDQRDKVYAYYRTGPYRDALDSVTHLKPMVCGYCALRQRFFGQAPMSGMFSTVEFRDLYLDFFRVFAEAVGDVKEKA
jgi:energy-coupling factor transporter ATP-binding protein EcfA2